MTQQSTQLILITGLPGSGKTTFARTLAEQLGLPRLNTDGIRSDLGLRGKYDEETKHLVYEELLRRAVTYLRAGSSVIVDATFSTPLIRQPFIEQARRLKIPIRWIELEADEHVIRNRVSFQRPDSEADFGVYLKLKEIYTSPDEPHLSLQSDHLSLWDMVCATRRYLAKLAQQQEHDQSADQTTAA